jgi:tight adherence protein B
MDMVVIAAILTGIAVLGTMLGIGIMLGDQEGLGSRLETYLGASDGGVEVPVHTSDDEQQSELAERINNALSGTTFAGKIQRDLARADIPLTVPEYLLLKIAATLIPTLLVLLISRDIIALPGIALVGFFAPTLWVKQRQRRRKTLFNDQLPDTLNTIVSSLRAGFSLVQALTNVAKESPVPTNIEMKRVVQEIQFGINLNTALENLAQRMESEDLGLITSVLKIHGRVGGNLTAVLESISNTIRDRSRLRREIRVITAQQRYSAYVLGLLPLIVGVLLFTINPGYMKGLFKPGITLCIPIGAAVFTVLGFLVIRKIVDIQI